MNNNSLKPCPFYGGNGTRKLIKPYRKIKGRGQSYLAIIGCETIGCTVEVSQAGFTREDAWNYAESRWNNRATKGAVRGNDIENAIEIMKARSKYVADINIDGKKAYETAIAALEQQLNDRWIPVTERLPKCEEEVEVTVEVRTGYEPYRFTCRAVYEDGTMWRDYSDFLWDDLDNVEYDDNHEDYKVPEGWYEAVTYAEETRNIDDYVIAWKPMPEPWREVSDEDNSER